MRAALFPGDGKWVFCLWAYRGSLRTTAGVVWLSHWPRGLGKSGGFSTQGRRQPLLPCGFASSREPSSHSLPGEWPSSQGVRPPKTCPWQAALSERQREETAEKCLVTHLSLLGPSSPEQEVCPPGCGGRLFQGGFDRASL